MGKKLDHLVQKSVELRFRKANSCVSSIEVIACPQRGENSRIGVRAVKHCCNELGKAPLGLL